MISTRKQTPLLELIAALHHFGISKEELPFISQVLIGDDDVIITTTKWKLNPPSRVTKNYTFKTK